MSDERNDALVFRRVISLVVFAVNVLKLVFEKGVIFRLRSMQTRVLVLVRIIFDDVFPPLPVLRDSFHR